MAQSKEDRKKDRIFNALIPKVEDSPIFKKREAFNWINHPKIQKASRGVWEAQEELHSKNETRRVFGGLTHGSTTLEEDRSLFFPTLVVFLFLSVVSSLLAGMLSGIHPEYSYWKVVLIFFLVSGFISLIVASWRAYVDLYPRAWWHYCWNMRHEEREPISSVEAVEYLISCFKKDSISELVKSFGNLSRYNRYREDASGYMDSLEGKKKRVEDVYSKKTKTERTQEAFTLRESSVEGMPTKINQLEDEVLVLAEEYSEKKFPSYREELKAISQEVLELQGDDNLGNVEDLIQEPMERKSEIEKLVIEDVKVLAEKFSAAFQLLSQIRSEKYEERTLTKSEQENKVKYSGGGSG